MIVIYFVISILILLVSRNVENKRIGIFVAFLLIVIIISGNYTNLDYDNYASTYDNQLDGHILEWGYGIFSVFCYNILHVDYGVFRLLITGIACMFFYLGINRYISNTNKYFCDIILLFIIFPFFWDIPVHRNFLGFTFLVFSLRFLEANRFKNILFFFITIILAASFQSLYYFYLPLCLVYFLRNGKSKWIKIGVFVFFILTFMPGSVISILQNYIEIFGDDRMRYVEGVSTRHGFLLNIAEQAIVFIAARYGYQLALYNKNNVNSKTEKEMFGLIEAVYFISMLGFAYCSLYRIQGNFVRLLYNQIPLVYLQYACVKTLIGNNCDASVINKYNAYSKLVYIYSIFFYCLVLISHWEDIVQPAFTNNWIIELFVN